MLQLLGGMRKRSRRRLEISSSSLSISGPPGWHEDRRTLVADVPVPLQIGDEQQSATAYPASILVIVLWHFLFLYHWNQRRTRRHLLVTYHSVVHRKRLHQLWHTLNSHPPVSLSTASTATTNTAPTSSQSAVPVNLESAVSSTESLFLPPNTNSPITRPSWNWLIQQHLRGGLSYIYHPWNAFYTTGAPLLVYNSHILWSCRALEVQYSRTAGSLWNYPRIMLCWGVVPLLFELLISHVLLKMIPFYRRAPAARTVYHDRLADMARQQIVHRMIGSPVVVTATVLTVFRIHYPFVEIPVLPFLSNPTELQEFPTISYLLSGLILLVLSRHCHFVTGVYLGAFTGSLWALGWIDFLADPYWNTTIFLVCALVTLLSIKAVCSSSSGYLPCIEHIAINKNGAILIQDERGGWIPQKCLELRDGMILQVDEDRDENSARGSTDGSHHDVIQDDEDCISAFAVPMAEDPNLVVNYDARSESTTHFAVSGLRPDTSDAEMVPLMRDVPLPLPMEWISRLRPRRVNGSTR